MVRRLRVLCWLVALWPGLALAQSAALMDAYNRSGAPYKQSLDSLADLYRAQGRYYEAEPLYRRSLAIREREFGPEHPKVAASLNNLADLYLAQGRYAAAEPLYRRSLAVREKALGSDHPDVATSLENYAALLRDTGRGPEADKFEARAEAIREKRDKENP